MSDKRNNKNSNTDRRPVFVPVKTRDKLKVIAKKNHRSMSRQIQKWVEDEK